MNKLLFTFFILLYFQFTSAATDQKISPEQCHTAASEVMKISEKAIPQATDKKNVAKLEKRIAGWKKRLNSDEDACKIYQDILKSSTNF